MLFIFCFSLLLFLMQKSTAKRAYRSATKREPHPSLYHSQCPSQAAVADSSRGLCVCVPLNQSNSSSNNNSSSSGSNSTGSVNWPPFANATQRVKCNREQRQENGKQKNKQTIELMKRSTNREMTNILLQVHALQLMRINVN